MMIVVSPSGASRSGAKYCRKLSLVPIAVETGRGLVCQPGGQPGDSHGRASLGFQDGSGQRKPARRNASAGTPCTVALGAARRTQQSQNPGKPLCDIPAGTADNRGPGGLPEALNRGLEASIKRPPGLVGNGPFQGFWGVGPWRGCFSATKYVPLIPWGYLERDFRPFKARVCPSDSDSPDRVVPRNFTAGSGSNGCNIFPTGD